MSHDTIDSLSEFLLHAGTEYRVFDMGRGLQPLSSQGFLEIENGQIPCPHPRQQKAWFAIVFWQAIHGQTLTQDKQYIWFLSLPIDEESHVVPASRNHFLQLVVDALQKDPTLEKGLADNPYVFAPTELQRAQLSAAIQTRLSMPVEDKIRSVITYIKAPGAADWQALRTQDVHFAAHVINSDRRLAEIVISAWPTLAKQFKQALLGAFEVIELIPQLQTLCINELEQAQATDKLAYLQALATESRDLSVQSVISALLAQADNVTMDLLSVIAARHYMQLTPGLLRLFFSASIALDEKLDKSGELFVGFYTDIVAIPALRESAIAIIRDLRRKMNS